MLHIHSTNAKVSIPLDKISYTIAEENKVLTIGLIDGSKFVIAHPEAEQRLIPADKIGYFMAKPEFSSKDAQALINQLITYNANGALDCT